ncbi:MarR family winged helix-turn-helix transcriptional regulator [Lacinutrix iliipiscaria]|uniref:MarR family winged helix-turn-helix transcriptional regulator n=1 Tax=Lacinutrix iliipiscaria TaxID=1230532 RepID=A0ABW5WNQ0_9FLAO
MTKSAFNIKQQETNLTSKIVVGLERVSEAFKVLLWEHAKAIGLSPIQIQILIFIAHHKQEYCNVSHFAQEFNVTKPTISDAVKVLVNKGFVVKEYSSTDSRRYSVFLSDIGQDIVSQTEGFANPIQKELNKINHSDLEMLYKSITNLIYGLNKTGQLSVQRMCYSCKFYESINKNHFCHYLNQKLNDKDIRVDCAEFELNK